MGRAVVQQLPCGEAGRVRVAKREREASAEPVLCCAAQGHAQSSSAAADLSKWPTRCAIFVPPGEKVEAHALSIRASPRTEQGHLQHGLGERCPKPPPNAA